MQPTETSDLLERVAALLQQAPAERPVPGPSESSLFAPPMAALADSSRGFNDVFGTDDRLFQRLAEAAERAGDAAVAGLLRHLEAGLADASLRPADAPDPVRRLTGFVYPVI